MRIRGLLKGGMEGFVGARNPSGGAGNRKWSPRGRDQRQSGQLGRPGWVYPCSKDHPHPRNQALKISPPTTSSEPAECQTPNQREDPPSAVRPLPSTREGSGRNQRTGQGMLGTPPFSAGMLPLGESGQEDSAVTCSKNSQPFAWLSRPCCSLALHHLPCTHSTSDAMDLNVFRSFLTTGPLHRLCPLPGARTPSCILQTSILTSLPPGSLPGPPLDQVYFMFSDLQLIICEIMHLFTARLHWDLQHRASRGRPLLGGLSSWLLAAF